MQFGASPAHLCRNRAIPDRVLATFGRFMWPLRPRPRVGPPRRPPGCPGGEDDQRALVEQVHVGPHGGVAGEGVEEGAHPRLLRADHGHGRVVAPAELRVGVDEGAAAPLGAHPRLQHLEDQPDLRPPVGRAVGEPSQEVPAPTVGPTQQVQRDEGVLGAEPVVEGLLRRARRLRDQVDADGPHPAVVEQLARRLQQPRARLRQRRQRLQHGAQGGGRGRVERRDHR